MTGFLTGQSALWVLFSTGFLSATLLPGGSEANLIALIHQGQPAMWLVILVATLGKTLGGMTNYVIGRWLPEKQTEKKQAQRALSWLKKYGYWTLLLSWLPIIGDPLCLAAGWLRMRSDIALVLIAIGKAVRYIVLAFMVHSLY